MAISPEIDGIVVLPIPDPPVEAGNGHLEELAPATESPAAEAPVAPPRRRRPAWVVPAAIASVGLIASGTLGSFFYTTLQPRDSPHRQLVATKGDVSKIDEGGTKVDAAMLNMAKAETALGTGLK